MGRNRAGAGDEAPARWKVPLATPGRRGDEAVGGASLGADRRVGLVARACSASAQTVTCAVGRMRSEEHTSELQSLMRISYAVFCLKKKKHKSSHNPTIKNTHNTTSITYIRSISLDYV